MEQGTRGSKTNRWVEGYDTCSGESRGGTDTVADARRAAETAFTTTDGGDSRTESRGRGTGATDGDTSHTGGSDGVKTVVVWVATDRPGPSGRERVDRSTATLVRFSTHGEGGRTGY